MKYGESTGMRGPQVKEQRIGLPIIAVLVVLSIGVVTAAEPENITDVLVDGENCRGFHVSTRPHNRKVVYHAPGRTWFIFYGTGHWMEKLGEEGGDRELIAWRSTRDGKTFTPFSPAIRGQGHSSSTDVMLTGDRLYASVTRFGYWRQKAGIPWKADGKVYYHRSTTDRPMFYVPYEVYSFEIDGDRLVAVDRAEALPGDRHVGHAGPHYGSMTRDTDGHVWVAARALAGKSGFSTWVARTTRPDDISAWDPHTVLFTSAGPGSHAPQIIVLDEGRVACVLFVKHEQMTFLFLFDPKRGAWGEPQIVGKGYESKRASAVFDPGSGKLHIVYIDSAGDARHRSLVAPFRPGNWSPPLDKPGNLVAEHAGTNKGDDDLSLRCERRPPGRRMDMRRGVGRCRFLTRSGISLLVPVERP